jgi:hypothetical protein
MSPRSLLSLCREEYILLARELSHKGLSDAAVEDCRARLAEQSDGRWYVKTLAYKPTGVALGSPLPNHRVQSDFHRAACQVERWMHSIGDPSAPSFAHVPPDFYHITVLNRSHYDVNEVVPMTAGEGQAVEVSLRALSPGTITVLASGLQLSRSGRVFVRCLPVDDTILALRERLSEAHPELRTNIPRLVHIKIGHLMKPLSRDELARFCLYLNRLGNSSIAQLDFGDVYTPLRRVPL